MGGSLTSGLLDRHTGFNKDGNGEIATTIGHRLVLLLQQQVGGRQSTLGVSVHASVNSHQNMPRF
jgi:hypothetical protein